jgi:uncharacterized membrane protein YraQ (UPF0718 family)
MPSFCAPPEFLQYICDQISSTMNLQDILAPIADLFQWTFGLLEAGSGVMTNVLIGIIFAAIVYWTFQLMKSEKSEVPNR